MKGDIKAIIFDIGGVLAYPTKPIKTKKGNQIAGTFNYVAKKLKISLDQLFDSLDTVYALSIVGKISKKQTLKTIANNLEINQEKLRKLFHKAYKRRLRKNKKLYRLAFKLKKKGYKIAILSDQWQISEEVLAPSKLMKKFNVVVISTKAGIRKPNPKIYKLVLNKLKLPAKATVFIDNQKWNLLPAKKIGMKTILFKDYEQTKKELEKLGVK